MPLRPILRKDGKVRANMNVRFYVDDSTLAAAAIDVARNRVGASLGMHYSSQDVIKALSEVGKEVIEESARLSFYVSGDQGGSDPTDGWDDEESGPIWDAATEHVHNLWPQFRQEDS